MALTITKSSTRAATSTAARSSSRRPVKVVAQAQSMRAAEASSSSQQQQQTRSVHAHASSAMAFSAPAEESSFFSQLAQFFNAPQPADEEWKVHFGHLLDEHEEQGARHNMYGSHLAERMALEPRMRS